MNSNVLSEKPGAYSPELGIIKWKVHFHSEPAVVYSALATDEGRRAHWAESAVETNGVIHFVFMNGIEDSGRVLKKTSAEFSVEYFGSIASFVLSPDTNGGTDLTLTASNVAKENYHDFYSGWVSWLMTMKAVVDFNVYFRNHDTNRTWFHGYADN